MYNYFQFHDQSLRLYKVETIFFLSVMLCKKIINLCIDYGDKVSKIWSVIKN